MGLAQETEQPPMEKEFRQEDVEELGEVTIEAERIYPAPGSAISRITAEDISQQIPLDTGYMLKGPKCTGRQGFASWWAQPRPVLLGFQQDGINVMINGSKPWGLRCGNNFNYAPCQPAFWIQPRVRATQRQNRVDPAFGEVNTAGFMAASIFAGLHVEDRKSNCTQR